MELHLYAPMRLHGRLQIEIYLHFNYCEIEPTETKYTPEQWHFYRREWAEDGHTAEQFVKWARDVAGSVNGKAYGQFEKWVISQTGYDSLNTIPITNICQ